MVNIKRRQRTGKDAEISLKAICIQAGRIVQLMPYQSPYDLLIDGWRVKVKGASKRKLLQGRPGWYFNIHRHGKLHEGEVDFYILVFDKVPEFKYSIFALVKAPVNKYVMIFSIRSLIRGALYPFRRDFEHFIKGKFGVGPWIRPIRKSEEFLERQPVARKPEGKKS